MVLLFRKHLFLPCPVPRKLCLAERKLSITVGQVQKQDSPGTDGLTRSARSPRTAETGKGAFLKHLMPGPGLPAPTYEIPFSNYRYLLVKRKL